MEIKDIEHLAKLARIEVTEREAESLAGSITDILAYVSEIEKVVGDVHTEKQVGPLHNVMREDGVPHEPGIYTEDLLNSAPEREGQYVKVKKIIEGK